MTQVTVSLPETLESTVEWRMSASGFQSKQEYLLDLVRADCEAAELKAIRDSRDAGPFEPLEADWEDKVRAAVSDR